ncbi:MAG: sulfite exporter TauE/SafE family protein [Sulfitobacter sp.]
MPEPLLAALQTEGLIWLGGAVIAAGLVRGFAGFGSAMIIMPAAAAVLSPVQAVVFVVAAELLGPLPNVPDALRQGVPREVGILILGALLGLPLGIWCLTVVEPDLFSWIISGVVLVLLGPVMLGWRYSGELTRRLSTATGALGGFMTGFAGIPGPPVIMLYMASRLPIAVIRANLLLYLFAIDLILFPLFWLLGLMVWPIALLGLLFGIPNVIANMVGARIFDPRAEALFRRVAYIAIVVSAIIGLPLWKG